MNACTIIARNYLAHARVLAQSFYEHHADGQFFVLVVDAEQPFAKSPGDRFEVMTPAEIGLARREVHRMAALYDVMEFATAVKPSFLKTLLEQGMTDVTYLDPDIEIFRPLDDISRLAREHSIVLTPHTLSPLPHDNREQGEVTLLLAGMFNLGFIAVSEQASRFLDWWAERVSRSGHVDPRRGQFVDQRWVDFVPSLFEFTTLRDPACNVAHWNLETRRFEFVDGEYRVDGCPLRFFHFSGFDPQKPHLLSKFLGPEPRILLSAHPALRRICDEYAEKLRGAGYDKARKERYGFDHLSNGVELTRQMRRLYGLELARAELRGIPEPPNPFDEGGADRFVAWLNDPAHPRAHGLTRFLLHLHSERADLQAAFPDPRWRDRERYLQWAWSAGRAEEKIPPEVLPEMRPEPEAPQSESGGVNVAGYFRTEAGVGQAARNVLAGLRAAGIPHTTFVYDQTPSRQGHEFEGSGETAYDVNIICVNADQVPRFVYDVGPQFFHDRHSIGIWWWEVARFPERFHNAFEVLNEVWVGSDFVRRAIAAETEKSVFVIPVCVELPDPAVRFSRTELGLPDSFLFLFSFDFDSRFERKNPLALVDAFRRAFGPNEGPALVFKTINGDRNLRDLELLRHATADRPDILALDGYVSAEETVAMTAACDCYVSLHRSEGLGLTMAEAMAHGKPVIATGYSGNLEFMNHDVSYLVPFLMTPIPPGVDPYPAGTEWADPDVDAAAELMRHVYENPDEAADMGGRARDHIAEHHSPQRTAAFLGERVSEIWRIRADAAATAAQSSTSGIDRASRYLSEGPTEEIRGPSAFGFVGRFARRVLYRVLRPYTSRHAEFETSVVDGLTELRQLIAAALEQGLRSEQHQRARFAAEIEQRAQNLSEHINRVDDDLATLSAGLQAVPYLSEPDFFQTTGLDGHEMLGYANLGERSSERKGYLGFEDIFRGSEDFIRDRQRAYVEILRGHEPVLDAGCGRGELLDLLRSEGIEALGVDTDSGMVAHCRAKGHNVIEAEVTNYLETQDDESLGAIFSAQVVEHMDYETLMRFFGLARRKLAPTGIFVMETVNPHSIQAMKTFWVDLTHEQPVFPEVGLALCRMHGFGSARVLFPNGTGDLSRDRLREGEYAIVAAVAPLSATAAGELPTGE